MNEIKRMVIFLTGGVVLAFFLGKIFTPSWNYPQFADNTGLSFYEFENLKTSPDVFFLGSSHMEYALSPIRMYEKDNIVSYNAATSAQCIEVTDFLVKEIFKKYSPKLIVMDAGVLFIDGKAEENYRYILDNSQLGINKLGLINGYLLNHQYFQEESEKLIKNTIGAYCPMYRYHMRWCELIASDFKSRNDTDYFTQGVNIMPYAYGAETNKEIMEEMVDLAIENQAKNQYVLNGNSNLVSQKLFDEEKYYQEDILDRNIPYFEEIYKVCTENECSLLLVKIPVMKNVGEYTSSWSSVRSKNTQEFASSYNVPFIDLAYDVDIEIDWMHDTVDKGAHLNFLGAEKVTDFLSEYLTANYNIYPKKTDEYDKKSILYNEYVDVAHIELAYDISEYISKIKQSNRDLILIISSKDDISNASEYDIQALKQIGLNTDFDDVAIGDSYIAIIDDGRVEYEALSNRRQYCSIPFDNEIFSISSAGHLDGTSSSIKINDQEYSMNIKGLNFLVYDKQSKLVVDTAICDINAGTHEVYHYIGSFLSEYQEYLMGRR